MDRNMFGSRINRSIVVAVAVCVSVLGCWAGAQEKGAQSNSLLAVLSEKKLDNSTNQAPVDVVRITAESLSWEETAAFQEKFSITHQRMQTTFFSNGEVVSTPVGGYTELGSGLLYEDTDGRTKRSKVKPVFHKNGTICFNELPVKYAFAAFADDEQLLITERDGEWTASAVAGLSYYDSSSGAGAVVAIIKHANVRAFEHGVVYEQAFKGIDADIVYRITKSSIQQDIQIFGGLPEPGLLGLDPDTTYLCVLTALLDVQSASASVKRSGKALPAVPSRASLKISRMKGNELKPLYNFERSYAFVEEDDMLSMSAESDEKTSVKGTLETVELRLIEQDNRMYLSEEIPLSTIRKQADYLFTLDKEALLEQDEATALILQRCDAQAAAAPPIPNRFAMRDKEVGEKLWSKEQNDTLEFAYKPRQARRYVIDYIDYNGTVTNDITFESGETYYISGDLALSDMTLTIEPGCFVKLATNTCIQLFPGAEVRTLCTTQNPALFTSAFDTDNAGESIAGCVGEPATNRYVHALWLQAGSTNPIQGLKIRYAEHAIYYNADDGQVFRNVTASNCYRFGRVMSGGETVTVANCRLTDMEAGFVSAGHCLEVRNCTFDEVGYIFQPKTQTNIIARDNLFACPSNVVVSNYVQHCMLEHNGLFHTNSAYTSLWIGANGVTTTNNPFADDVQGNYYLDASSAMINAGSTNAGALCMYHYTTQTDHAKESNTVIDIGFHYLPITDTDNDGLHDTFEDSNGNGIYESDLDYSSWTNADTEGDGMPDGWEVDNGFDPKVNDGQDDADSDGLSNAGEYQAGADPFNADTDDDGLEDGEEVNTYGTSPIDADTDDDYLTDEQEIRLGTTPLLIDGDTNGIPDGEQIPGVALRQYWLNIPHNNVTNLTVDADYPENPDGCQYIESLDGPADWGDNYGARIQGCLMPPENGSYTFYIAGDNQAQLFLSTNNQTAGKVLIAEVPKDEQSWTAPYAWNTYTNQQSAALSLEAGSTYYFEVLHKEGSLDDHLAVAWQWPGTTSIVVITGANFATARIPADDQDQDGMSDYWENHFFGNLSQTDAADPDGDNLSNLLEYQHATCPTNSDTDRDGLTDGWEVEHGTSPTSIDTDSDGMSDDWEVLYGLDPLIDDAAGDLDDDNLNNFGEYQYMANPTNKDTDADLLVDGAEIARYSTSPTDSDSNNNGNSDSKDKLLAEMYGDTELGMQFSFVGGFHLVLYQTEVTNYYEFYFNNNLLTNWYVAETYLPGEADGYLDWYDMNNGPGRAYSGAFAWYAGCAKDTDGDGIGDGYEVFTLHTYPDDEDSDNNGISDGDEDPDNDGKTNSEEYNSPGNANYNSCMNGSSYPYHPDTDEDGVCDGPNVPPPWDLIAGPDMFPLDPSAWQDTDCDGDPDELNPLYDSNSSPLLVADTDDDNDTIPDTWEIQHFGTSTGAVADADADGDDVTNLEEYNAGTNPTNKYSVPPLNMLSTSGGDIVDESGTQVQLRGVNLGSWLTIEHWMTRYLPGSDITNSIGQVVNEVDETTLHELLVDNVDFAVTRYATNHNGTSGYLTMNGYEPWWCPVPSYVGSFSSNDYLKYNLNFGEGVSNLSVILSTPNTAAVIHVCIDNPSADPLFSFEVVDTGGWANYTEQKVGGFSISGNHSVYFVGESSNGDIGNICRFRFYNDPNTRKIINTYRDAFIQTNDLDHIRDLGYNCVRVPFPYSMLMSDDASEFYDEGFNRLNTLFHECGKRRIWCVLDLHCAPGGQSDLHHNGQPKKMANRLWTSHEYKNRTITLWEEIAQRFETNPVIAGYGLMNEPIPPAASTNIWDWQDACTNHIIPLYDDIYDGIRAYDNDHIIFMEDNMHGNINSGYLSWVPTNDLTRGCNSAYLNWIPQTRAWNNVVVEMHSYEHTITMLNDVDDWTLERQKSVADRNVYNINTFREERNIPVLIGEFCPGDPHNYEYAIQRYDANKINWCHWNYRHWGWSDSTRPNRGWNGYSLTYRDGGIQGGVNTSIQPNIMSDDYDDLTNKFGMYTYDNYRDHTALQSIMANNAAQDETPYTEFYLNTFSSAGNSINQGWPWTKIAGIGNDNAFKISGKEAKLELGYGPVAMRYKSRYEADARFKVNDENGCWFEIQPCNIYVSSIDPGIEAELRIVIVRDEITNVVKQYNTEGLIAVMEYDAAVGSTNVNLYVYRKEGGLDTYGDLLFSVEDVTFSTNTLKMHITSNSLSLVYNGTTHYATTDHGLDVNEWPDGAVCVVEAEDICGDTEYAYLDNFKAWYTDITPVTSYDGTYTNAPDGMTLLSWMSDVAVPTNNSNARDTLSYVTNHMVRLIPKDGGGESVWLNPRKDFQNDLRLDASGGDVAEVRISLHDFTQGTVKIGLMPEYFYGRLYDDWDGVALYLEAWRDGNNIKFRAYRSYGLSGSRDPLNDNEVVQTYDVNKDITVQVSSTILRAYYGTGASAIINESHGITDYTEVYPRGLHPHIEFQTVPSQGYVDLEYLRCQLLGSFTIP